MPLIEQDTQSTADIATNTELLKPEANTEPVKPRANTEQLKSKPKAKVLKPRRGLPSGRAVLGALLVTLSAVGAFALASRNDQVPDTSYLVVTQIIEAGQAVNLDDVALIPMTLPHKVARNAVSSMSGVDGAIATRDLVEGDVISTRDLIAATDPGGVSVGAVHEMSLPVARDRIAGRIVAGDLVTILVTLRHKDENITMVGIEDARTLKWSSENSTSSKGILTLALASSLETMGLAHLIQQGEVTVIRTTRAAVEQYPPYISTGDLLTGLTETTDWGTTPQEASDDYFNFDDELDDDLYDELDDGLEDEDDDLYDELDDGLEDEDDDLDELDEPDYLDKDLNGDDLNGD